MKHMHACFIFLMLIFYALPIEAAPRTRTYGAPSQAHPNVHNLTMIPVNVTPKESMTQEEERDRELFIRLLSIAANFGNVLLDPHNKPHVLHNVKDMISNIVLAAETITKSKARTNNPEDVEQTIAELCAFHAHNSIQRYQPLPSIITVQ